MKTLCRALCLVSAALMLLVASAQAQGILVKDAWVRGVPASAKSTAAFMTIQNDGPAEAVLVSAACAVAELVQIHTVEQVGEVMTMREIEELRIPAHGQAVLAPKGYHVMLLGLKRPLAEGETIPLTLNFAGGATVEVDAVVRKWAPMAPMSHN